MFNWERKSNRSSVLIQNQHHCISWSAESPLGFCPVPRTGSFPASFTFLGLFSTLTSGTARLRVTLSVCEHLSSCQPVSGSYAAQGSGSPAALLSWASDLHGIRPCLGVNMLTCMSLPLRICLHKRRIWMVMAILYKSSRMFLSCMTKSQLTDADAKGGDAGVWGSCSWRTQFLKLQGLIQPSPG